MGSNAGKLGTDANGVVLNTGDYYPLRHQTVNASVGAAANSAALGDDALAVRLLADTTMYVKFGDTNSVAAATTDMKILANQPERFITKSARYVSVIGGAGTLRITELG